MAFGARAVIVKGEINLAGAHAGRTVLVDRAEAARLCEGWQPQAELVAVNRAETRETR